MIFCKEKWKIIRRKSKDDEKILVFSEGRRSKENKPQKPGALLKTLDPTRDIEPNRKYHKNLYNRSDDPRPILKYVEDQ